MTHNWTEDALCARSDPEAWFPQVGESNTTAKELCHTCPVIDACLQWALDYDIQFGIWGGTSRADRQRIKREQVAA